MAFLAFCRKLTKSLTIAVGLCVATGALTMMYWPDGNLDRWHRLAFLPLLLLVCSAWAILCVAIARKAGWSARAGVGLAMATFSAAYLVALLVSSKPPAWGGFSACLVWFCRRVLYSDSEWNAGAPAEQLTTLHLNS